MSAYGQAAYGSASYGVDTTTVRRTLKLMWDVEDSTHKMTPKKPIITEIDKRPKTAEVTAIEKRGER